MAQRFYVYVLIDPRDMAVRYVGCSIDPVKRLRHDINASRLWSVKRLDWIASVLNSGLDPIQCVIEEHDSVVDAAVAETAWISLLRSKGAELVNAVRSKSGYKLRGANTKPGAKELAVREMRSVAAAFARESRVHTSTVRTATDDATERTSTVA